MIYIYIYIYSQINMYIYIHIHTNIYIHVYIYIYIYIYNIVLEHCESRNTAIISHLKIYASLLSPMALFIHNSSFHIYYPYLQTYFILYGIIQFLWFFFSFSSFKPMVTINKCLTIFYPYLLLISNKSKRKEVSIYVLRIGIVSLEKRTASDWVGNFGLGFWTGARLKIESQFRTDSLAPIKNS